MFRNINSPFEGIDQILKEIENLYLLLIETFDSATSYKSDCLYTQICLLLWKFLIRCFFCKTNVNKPFLIQFFSILIELYSKSHITDSIHLLTYHSTKCSNDIWIQFCRYFMKEYYTKNRNSHNPSSLSKTKQSTLNTNRIKTYPFSRTHTTLYRLRKPKNSKTTCIE